MYRNLRQVPLLCATEFTIPPPPYGGIIVRALPHPLFGLDVLPLDVGGDAHGGGAPQLREGAERYKKEVFVFNILIDGLCQTWLPMMA